MEKKKKKIVMCLLSNHSSLNQRFRGFCSVKNHPELCKARKPAATKLRLLSFESAGAVQ